MIGTARVEYSGEQLAGKQIGWLAIFPTEAKGWLSTYGLGVEDKGDSLVVPVWAHSSAVALTSWWNERN